VSRTKRRADRIREQVPIIPMLGRYNFDGIDPSHDVEQQFKCHLHGHDQKPSARVYPSTNSFHCWACGKSRDPISLVMDAENIDLFAAMLKLEEENGFDPMPFDPEEEKGPALTEQVAEAHRSVRTFEQGCDRLDRMLRNQTTDQDLPMDTVLSYWEAFDRILYGCENEGWTEEQGKEQIVKLRLRLMERIGSM
jgi:hypothetical protein